MKYIVCSGRTITELERYVNNKLTDNYTPIGGVTRSDVDGIYLQAMFRRG